MKGEWMECKLADVCRSIDYGLTASATDLETGLKFLRITDIVSGQIDWKTVPYVTADAATCAKFQLRDGDIVLARTGASTGVSAYIKNPPHAVFASYLVRLQMRPDFDSRYIAYYLKSDYFWSFIRGVLGDKSAQPNVSASTMTKAPLRIPQDKTEQRAIAQILGTLDDKIELNRRLNETLEALAQTQFQKLMQEGGGREVRLPEVMEVNPPRSLRKGEVAPYLDMANMPTRSARALEVSNREFKSGVRFMDGDTLVARITPCLENGKTCFVDFLGEGKVGWGSTEFIVLRPKAPLPVEYAYFLARSEEFCTFAISNMTGTSGRQRVPADCFQDFEILVPTGEQLERFGQIAHTVFAKMKANDEESRTLAALRDALLPKLISGEIRVKDAERFLKERGL